MAQTAYVARTSPMPLEKDYNRIYGVLVVYYGVTNFCAETLISPFVLSRFLKRNKRNITYDKRSIKANVTIY